jgi:hypothetical protein
MNKLVVGTVFAVGLAVTAGQPHERLTDTEVADKAHELILDEYRVADNEERFAMQYLQDDRLPETVTVGDMQNGRGWLGNIMGMWGQETSFPVGQIECGLDDSDYDIENDIEGQNFRQLFPDDQEPSSETLDDGTFVVYPSPAGEHTETLAFSVGQNGTLNAANETTVFILRQAGCSPFYETPHIVETDPTSPLALGDVLGIDSLYVNANENFSRAA